ncbi:SURF1 family cytochrome oxidase biogenesis protein [Phenylobacterium sp.]|uniref:SURF1 family protein n=1 Tax=Phenylobacterium sp. TaxID=1871053 RepID=UPI00286C35EA|nr:SURF1 family cytochrome oxidase biogenesis protein [Phenylobacterium sp.]
MTDAWEPKLAPRPARPEATGFPVGLTVATAIAFCLLIGLGAWQMQRLKWKEDLLAHLAALEAAPARALEPVLDSLSQGREVSFTRVSVTCPGLATAPFLEVYDLRNGQVGERLVSACAVQSARYRSVLVDRGYVADTVTARPPVDPAATDPLRIVGVLRPPERGNFATPKNTAKRWYLRDVRAMAAVLKAPAPAPIILFAETSSNPAFKALVPAPLPVEILNHHFEYALTWFGLAGGLVGVYAAVLSKRIGLLKRIRR